MIAPGVVHSLLWFTPNHVNSGWLYCTLYIVVRDALFWCIYGQTIADWTTSSIVPASTFLGSVKYHIRLLHVTCYMNSSCVWVKKPGTLGTLKQLGIMDVYSVYSPSHISHIVIGWSIPSSFPSCRHVAQLHRTDLALQILTFGRSAEEQQQQHHHHKPWTICIHKHR